MEPEDFIPPFMEDNALFHARHPLQNSVVISTLFKKLCPAEDLPKYRLVCKQWFDTSLDIFRSTRTLRLNYSKTLGDNVSKISISYSLQQLLDYLEDPSTQCSKIPYRKLHLNSWPFQLGPNGMFSDPLIERFCWSPILGSRITTLTLSLCKFGGVKEFQLIIYRFCPLLQSLTLNGSNECNIQKYLKESMSYQEPEYGEQLNLKSLLISDIALRLPVSWVELFSHFPSLRSIGIRVFRNSKILEVLEALQVVKTEDGNKLPINDFDVKPSITISGDEESLRICAILKEYSIPIKRVHFKLDAGISRELVQDLIELQANSVIFIEVYKYANLDWSFQLGVSLPKLEKLIISADEDFVGDVEFLQYVPNLETLSLLSTPVQELFVNNRHPPTRMVANTLDTDGMTNLQLLKLKELKMDFKVSAEDVRRLVKWLPNIQTLEMALDDAGFSVVCQNWRQLESVAVHGSDLTDTGIIGFTFTYDEDDEDEPVTEIGPNVTYLENLTSFKAKDCNEIGEAAVFLGFLKMRKLSRLQLQTVNVRAGIALRRKGITREPRDSWSRH